MRSRSLRGGRRELCQQAVGGPGRVGGAGDDTFGQLFHPGAVAQHGARVSLVLKADIRPGRTGEMQGKLERLEAALEQT